MLRLPRLLLHRQQLWQDLEPPVDRVPVRAQPVGPGSLDLLEVGHDELADEGALMGPLTQGGLRAGLERLLRAEDVLPVAPLVPRRVEVEVRERAGLQVVAAVVGADVDAAEVRLGQHRREQVSKDQLHSPIGGLPELPDVCLVKDDVQLALPVLQQRPLRVLGRRARRALRSRPSI